MDQIPAASIKDVITVPYTAHSRREPGQPENPGQPAQIDQRHQHGETGEREDEGGWEQGDAERKKVRNYRR